MTVCLCRPSRLAALPLAPQGDDAFGYAAFRLETCSSMMPMMSDSFMIRSSWPSILTSVPDHLPNSTRSPSLLSIGMSLPASSRPPGPTAMTSPWEGFFLSGIRDDDDTGGFLLGIDALDNDAVVKRTKLH